MRKIILAIFLLTLTFDLELFSLPVDSLQAIAAANNFFSLQSKSNTKQKSLSFPQAEIIDVCTNNESVYYYVVENKAQPSWVILSGDDRITPVIAYADGMFSDETNPTFEWWMSVMREEINAIMSGSNSKTRRLSVTRHTGWTKLLNNQEDFFTDNNSDNTVYTPGTDLMNGIKWHQNGTWTSPETGNMAAGCVATAMGQVVKYWSEKNNIEYLHGKGAYEYTDYGTNTDEGIVRSVNFEEKTYNIKGMPLDAPNDLTRDFLYDVGVSVRMQYNNSSGSLNLSVPSALFSHFGFKPAEYRRRIVSDTEYYSIDEWKSRIRNEIDAERPVIYGGQKPQGSGHSFVVSGYKQDDTFYFNWGWGGRNNGWYKITLLDSEGAQGVNYSEGQEAIFGLEPFEEGESLPYRIYDVRMEYNSANCGVRDQYHKEDGYRVYMKFKIENKGASANIPVTLSYYASLTNANYRGSVARNRFRQSFYVEENQTLDAELSFSTLSLNYFFDDNYGIKDFNCDLGMALGDWDSNTPIVDIGRNPKRIKYSKTAPSCDLSPISITHAGYLADGKISVVWEKTDYLKQDESGSINLYKTSSADKIDNAPSAKTGVMTDIFNFENSAVTTNYILKHEAEDKNTPEATYTMPAYPQIKALNAEYNDGNIELNWELYYDEATSDYVTGDQFEIECYAEADFTGDTIWIEYIDYVSGQKDYEFVKPRGNVEGEVYIRIRRTYTKDVWKWNYAVSQTSLTIAIPVESVALSENNVEIFVDESYTLSATVLPENATNKKITWVSSDENVVSVANGQLTALKAGEAIITVSTEDGSYSDACMVVVKLKGTTGSPQGSIEQPFLLYPNPVNDILYIQSEIPFISVTICDVEGQVMKHVENNVPEIDMSNLSEGIYLVKIWTLEGNFIHKIKKK
ncbi:T9SS C-terminal target domain-containing protein [Paludibacter sp. 221]|uniref:C10 family peptidase n=1 Tax=Paludibacter sp. 221 TaxID=2302939 RepID=UPI0013D25457|nr:C10 family peptidase [Paludibacter sp. 221]NDV47229.1 T9SS C-terminal target domain-containing protein [Paludibacter sp. 221]